MSREMLKMPNIRSGSGIFGIFPSHVAVCCVQKEADGGGSNPPKSSRIGTTARVFFLRGNEIPQNLWQIRNYTLNALLTFPMKWICYGKQIL